METISLDTFASVTLVTGRIEEAQAVPGSKKLLQLMVAIGEEKRQIVAGIAPYVTPEELMGQSCIVVANLAPKMLAGIESQGMLLAGVAADGSFALASCPGVAIGTRVR